MWHLPLMGAVVGLVGLVTPAAQAQQGPTRVVADRVVEETISQTASVLGRIVASESGDVAAQTSGPVARVLVTVGDVVRQGQALAELDLEDVRLQLAQAQADVVVAQAQRAAAQAQVAQAREGLQRVQRLRNSAAFSQARLDDSRREVEALSAGVDVSVATISQKEAAVESIAVVLDRGIIRAPYSGVITDRKMSAGDYASEGEALFSMINTSALEVEADVPSNRLAALTPGFLVRGQLEGGGPLLTVVRTVIPVENPLTRTRAVRFTLQRTPEVQLAVGQSVTLEVPVDEPRLALTVDKDAIVGGNSVFVAQDGVATPRQVRLGQALGSRFEVLEGLQKGDLVVVRGNERLRPGQQIQADVPSPAARAVGGASAVDGAVQPLDVAAVGRDAAAPATSPRGQPLPPDSPK